MPFDSPTTRRDYGDREGATRAIGSLAPPAPNGSIFQIGADIVALPPVGLIYTLVSAGFEIVAPPNASMLLVTFAGRAWFRGLAETLGAYAHAHAEISITIEEWVHRSALALGSPKLVRTITFNPTQIFDIWAAVAGLQFPNSDSLPVTSVAGMPISNPGVSRYHSYKCWINLIQQADVSAVTGAADAISNVAIALDSVFAAFF